MPTIIVGPKTKARNFFTKFGRNKNHLYKEMKNAGYVEIRERNLPNGSTVALGYKDSAKTNDIAFMLHPDLTMQQKTITKQHFLLPWKHEGIEIQKIYANDEGVATRVKDARVEFVNDQLVEKRVVDNDFEGMITNHQYKKHGGVSPNYVKYNEATGNIIKSTEKVKNDNNYCVLERSNGQRTYIKNINGVNYTFTSK